MLGTARGGQCVRDCERGVGSPVCECCGSLNWTRAESLLL